jgi:co-chaperonin GroES (HSP10)
MRLEDSVVRPTGHRPEEGIGRDLRPIMDTIFIERFDVSDLVGRERLIELPDAYRGRACAGRVFACGPGMPVARCVHEDERACHLPMDIAVGDYVLFPLRGGRDLQHEVGGEILEFVALKEYEVLAIIGRDPAAPTRKVVNSRGKVVNVKRTR